jgi:predicted membrane protein
MDPRSIDIPRFSTPRVLVGVGLVVFGAVLLLDRLGVVGANEVLRLWPLVLILIGVQQFFTPRVGPAGERLFKVNGIIWMVVGGLFLLNSLGIMEASVWELFWPAVLIGIGVRLMTRSNRRGRLSGSVAGTGDGGDWSADSGPVFAVLSGVKRVSAPVTYTGADVTIFMGGAHLDLRRAVLKPGQEAVIDMVAVMGGCEIFVPPDWVVSAPLIAVLGGIEDKRLPQQPTVIDQATAAGPPPRLVLHGMVLMGGITIRS